MTSEPRLRVDISLLMLVGVRSMVNHDSLPSSVPDDPKLRSGPALCMYMWLKSLLDSEPKVSLE